MLSTVEQPLIRRWGRDENQERHGEQTGAASSGHSIHPGNQVRLTKLPTNLGNQANRTSQMGRKQ
jgi:hypothetical protein